MIGGIASIVIVLSAATAAPPAPKNFELVEARVKLERLLDMVKGDGFSLPQLRVYDRDGRLLHDFGRGFAAEAFERELSSLVASPVAPTERPSQLQQELSWLDLDEPLTDPATITFVEYWAEWCMPCHMQFDALKAFLEKQDHPPVRVVHVEADAIKALKQPH